MVVILLPLLGNHDNLVPQSHQKKSCLDEGWFFIARFKVGSVPAVRNKEALAQFTYKSV